MIGLKKIRAPKRTGSRRMKTITTIIIFIAGVMIGVLQKWIDGTPVNELPLVLQQMDIGNYFGRLAIWILLAVIISVFSKTPFRASINTFLFFIGMIAGYYAYCHFVLGFLPVSYMMLWIAIAFAAFFLAYICWYAKGRGVISILISACILGVLLAQAVSLLQGIYVYHVMELITWVIAVLILWRKPKELLAELGLCVVIAVVYQWLIPYYG